ncbi:tetratricopeptide repeat protein 31 isoform X2 [Xyrichtys novacula]|uniref:Tetratricopeptide repeat protein 31 isoform X2 n=1 Tax=Xyrichtys novacula TaxID=13765 RepID=A0AAV1GKW3_XYRNO|nr:tetratricopeptide repeat protein 31 isoform X2 [Xyrichtys novacula]
MSRRRLPVRAVAPAPRVRENPGLVRAQETIMDYMVRASFLDSISQGFFGFNFLRSFHGDPDEDYIYSDSDSDDDYYDDHFSSPFDSQRPLEPHPRIRQLTEEEADKHAKELIAEEERQKGRTERNKRKKLRKKEKKRLEKENAAKSIIPEEEEQQKSESSEIQGQSSTIESSAVENDPPEMSETKTEPEEEAEARCEESREDNKEERLLEIDKKEEEEKEEEEEEREQKDSDNSAPCTDETTPEEEPPQRPEEEHEKMKPPEVEESKEVKPEVKEKPEVQKRIEEKQKPIKEPTIDPAAEDFARKSRELAGNGNRLAAAGQYEMAVKYFTDAIKYNPKEFKLFGNRSLCYERLQQYENALRDADLALTMEPNWIRGLFRKGKALCGLKRYYEASLIYQDVLKLEQSSDAMQELKRAQTLHLMEMGFTWAQSSEALKTHSTLEEAVEALFGGDSSPRPAAATASWTITKQPSLQKDNDDEGEWIVQQSSRPRTQQVKETEALDQIRSKSQSPTPHSRSPVKPALFSVWVGSLAPAITYATLHEVFSRVGTVYSIKMLLEQQCAFINYTKKEDCDRAVQCINGMLVEGAPLSVKHPGKFNTGLGTYKKECFFWRTSGCTRQDCTFRHVPENKSIDREKFTSRLGNFHI